jgi:hypothetical protein
LRWLIACVAFFFCLLSSRIAYTEVATPTVSAILSAALSVGSQAVQGLPSLLEDAALIAMQQQPC